MARTLGSMLAVLSTVAIVNTAAASPIDASMNLLAQLRVDGISTEGAASDSWGTLLDPLHTDTAAGYFDILLVRGSGTSTWSNGGNSGSVIFSDYGWSTGNLAGASASMGLQDHSAGEDWSYTFQADADGTFTMDYQVIGSGSNLFGLWGWEIFWSGPGGGLNPQNPLDPTASGTFVRPLTAGSVYTVQLSNNANIGSPGDNLAAFMDGNFDWRIESQPVPEPSTMVLLGSGLLGLAGLARKRIRK